MLFLLPFNVRKFQIKKITSRSVYLRIFLYCAFIQFSSEQKKMSKNKVQMNA